MGGDIYGNDGAVFFLDVAAPLMRYSLWVYVGDCLEDWEYLPLGEYPQ